MIWQQGLLFVWSYFSLCAGQAAGQQIWPNPTTDELEDIVFLNTGYRARNFASPVTPCTAPGSGRVAAAEWVRTAFHDMATGNVVQGIGGLDASIVYELRSSDNAGSAFNSTLLSFEPFYGPQSSMADLIALGVRTAVRACGGPMIPLRTGRVDATTQGGTGVPQPQNAISTFQNQFARMGFNDSGMVTLVACGHTLGGVHASNQPLIVAPGSAPPYDTLTMDSSPATFDNRIATEYVAGNTTNPLVGGLSTQYKRNSDKVVFQVDNNATIQSLTNADYFKSQCRSVLQQMIEVVPKRVTLSSDPMVPYECKPSDLQLYLQDGGKTLAFSGNIRIRTTSRPISTISKVQITYKDRLSGSNCGSCLISARSAGQATGLDDTFAFYNFATNISATTSISSFTVTVFKADGSSEVFANGGGGYPVVDNLLLQSPQTCVKGDGTFTVMAAVRSDITSLPVVNAITKSYSPGIIRPTLNNTSGSFASTSTLGSYTLYKTTVALNMSQVTLGSRFNLTIPGTSYGVGYQDLMSLPTACAAVQSQRNSSWSGLGCITDSVSSRTLNSAQKYDSSMTTETCATFCRTYHYFGTEYSQECYCSNMISSTATNATDASQSCNMPCSGDSTETCGGSSYLNLYQNPASNLLISPSTIKSYSFAGCYTDSPSARALSDYRKDDSTLTLETCASYCISGGYSFMGAEYGGECYCAHQLAESSAKADIWDCAMGCRGNSSEACGAANRLTLYSSLGAPSSNTSAVSGKRNAAGRRHLNSHAHRNIKS